MKALRTSLITAGLLAALATSAFAQPGMAGHGEGQAGQRTEKMREHMAARHQQRLTDLKTQLQLQPQQDAAWKTFADAMQPPTQPGVRLDRVSMEKLSTPERIDQMLAMQEQRAAEMKKRSEATKAFYANLNVEQKKTFDKVSGHWMGQHGHPMGHGMGQHMGQHMGHRMHPH